MITVMWAALGALAGVGVLVGAWSVRAIVRDIREERADREAVHVARHARVPQIHHDERRGQPQNDGWQRAGLAGRAPEDLPPVAAPKFLPAPGEGRPVPTPPVGAGPTSVPGWASTPAGEPAPRLASVAPGPESEPPRAPVPAPATRQGPGAGLPLQRSPVTTATCAGGQAPKVDSPAPAPHADRLAAELAATSPWLTHVPFARWESDTFVGGMLAIQDGA